MSLSLKITGEISPFFKFANKNNPSEVVRTWPASDCDEKVRTQLVYQNCVSCNKQRFKEVELSEFSMLGKNTYFCDLCNKKVARLVLKYEKYPEFQELWDNFLFGQK